MLGLKAEPYTVQEIYDRDNGICGLCGEYIDRRLRHPNKQSLSIDHIIPVIAGGNDTKDNVQIAHLICNTRKSAHGFDKIA